jgi:hypothetical protein
MNTDPTEQEAPRMRLANTRYWPVWYSISSKFRKQITSPSCFFYEVVQPEVNEKDVETMVKMGFPRDQCIQELRYYHQSVR